MTVPGILDPILMPVLDKFIRPVQSVFIIKYTWALQVQTLRHLGADPQAVFQRLAR